MIVILVGPRPIGTHMRILDGKEMITGNIQSSVEETWKA